MQERRGASERYLGQAIRGREVKLKRRRVPESMDVEEEATSKRRSTPWEPPSGLGSQQAWLDERDRLVGTAFPEQSGLDEPRRRERAEELLHMIEAIGCKDVMAAWHNASMQEKSTVKLEAAAAAANDLKAICQFVDKTQSKSFKDKALLRVGKVFFTLLIVKEIERIKTQVDINRPKPPPSGKGHVLYQAINGFLESAYPGIHEDERDKKHRKFRDWWYESQIWVRMYSVYGFAILLLIPDGHCTKNGRSISNKQ